MGFVSKYFDGPSAVFRGRDGGRVESKVHAGLDARSIADPSP